MQPRCNTATCIRAFRRTNGTMFAKIHCISDVKRIFNDNFRPFFLTKTNNNRRLAITTFWIVIGIYYLRTIEHRSNKAWSTARIIHILQRTLAIGNSNKATQRRPTGSIIYISNVIGICNVYIRKFFRQCDKSRSIAFFCFKIHRVMRMVNFNIRPSFYGINKSNPFRRRNSRIFPSDVFYDNRLILCSTVNRRDKRSNSSVATRIYPQI